MSRPNGSADRRTKYKLHVVASHPKTRLHSQLCGTKLRETYAIAGRRALLDQLRRTRRRAASSDGDIVRVFNDRGQILAGAKVTEVDASGVIRVNEGGWYDPARARQAGNPVASTATSTC